MLRFPAAAALAAVSLGASALPARAVEGKTKGPGAAELVKKAKESLAVGKNEEAAGLFRAAWEAEHGPENLYNEGSAWVKARRPDRAVAAFEAFLAAVPPTELVDRRASASRHIAEQRLLLGKALKEKGDCAGAVEQFTLALERAPAIGEAWVHVGDCAERAKDTAGARAAYEKALGSAELDSTLRALVEARLAALAAPAPSASLSALVDPTAAAAGPDGLRVEDEPLDPRSTAPRKRPPWAAIGAAAGGAVAVGVVVTVLAVVLGRGQRVEIDPASTDLGVMTIGGF